MRYLFFILSALLFSCHQKQPEGNTIYHRLIDDLEVAAKRIKKDNIATFVQSSHAAHWLRPADLKLVRQMYLIRKETDRISNYLDSMAAGTNIVDLKPLEQQFSNYLSLLDSLSDETFAPLINTSVMDPFAL